MMDLTKAKQEIDSKGWCVIDVSQIIGCSPRNLAQDFVNVLNKDISGEEKIKLSKPCDELLKSNKFPSSGIGMQTNIIDLPKQIKAQQNLRPVFAALYGVKDDEVQMHWERFGIKGGGTPEMMTHWDSAFVGPAPWKERKVNDATAFGPRQRVQCAVCLSSGLGAGWLGWEGCHKDEVYTALGKEMGWPHEQSLPRAPFKVPANCYKIMTDNGCKRVNVNLKPGEAVFWWNGVAHGNLAVPKDEIPRVTMYANYALKQPYDSLEASRVVGMGNFNKSRNVAYK